MYIYIYIYIHVCVYIYIYICVSSGKLLLRAERPEAVPALSQPTSTSAALQLNNNKHTNITNNQLKQVMTRRT